MQEETFEFVGPHLVQGSVTRDCGTDITHLSGTRIMDLLPWGRSDYHGFGGTRGLARLPDGADLGVGTMVVQIYEDVHGLPRARFLRVVGTEAAGGRTVVRLKEVTR